MSSQPQPVRSVSQRLSRMGWSHAELAEALAQCGIGEARALRIAREFDGGLIVSRRELTLLHELLDALEQVEVPLEVSDASGREVSP